MNSSSGNNFSNNSGSSSSEALLRDIKRRTLELRRKLNLKNIYSNQSNNVIDNTKSIY